MEKNRRNNAYIQFSTWLKNQPYWLQDSTWHIYNGEKIDDIRMNKYVDMCLSELKGNHVKHKKIQLAEIVSVDSSTDLSILKISEVNNVNALSNNAELEFFKKGVTIVYGLNGAGKSGFMRTFKHVSGSPYKEHIQPNIFSDKNAKNASCKFTVIEDNKEKQINCDLYSLDNSSVLRSVDVFDTKISNQYITSTNNVSYQPFVFTVLSETANVADRIKDLINTRIKLISEINITIPHDYLELKTMDWFKNIKAESKLPDEFIEWTEENDNRLKILPKELDNEKVNQRITILETTLNSLELVYEDLNLCYKIYDSKNLQYLSKNFYDSKSELDKANKLFSANANQIDKVSINSSDWKSLWNTALEYYQMYIYENNGNLFGEEDSICPLCHQEIKNNIYNRFSTVNQYINGKFSKKNDLVNEEILSFAKDLVERVYSSDQIINQLQGKINKENLKEIIGIYNNLSEIKNCNSNKKILSKLENFSKINFKKTLDSLYNKILKTSYEIENLKKSLNLDEQRKKEKEFIELKNHKWVFDNKEKIQKKINNLKDIQEYKKSKKLVLTNKITYQTNFLANTLITKAYIKRFEDEIKFMAPNIKVKLEKAPAQKGSSPYKISINNGKNLKCKPEDILSEGEQRIVALATFFADATGRNDSTPIVIDDPISSLDINYERRATERIVELAKNRQVIVFTHRISMLKGIESKCEDSDVLIKKNFIRSGVNEKGILDFDDIYHGNLKSKLNGLLGRIKEIRKLDANSRIYASGIDEVCQKFRISVERTVEDELIQGMVKRFDHRITTMGKINKISRISPEDCNIIDDMMTKYSFKEHSQPIDSPPIVIDIDEVEDDILFYRDWLIGFRNKMKNN